jgi:glucose-6-phosphate 1-epimerase
MHSNHQSPFDQELYDIPCLRIGGKQGNASVAAQGAQALSWIDQHGRERLYLSPQTSGLGRDQDSNASGPAIRGGVPVCFPQFSDRGVLTKHGFVRNRTWKLLENKEGDSSSTAVFRFTDDESTRADWPHRFNAELRTELSAECLHIRFQVENPGNSPFSFSLALHTYLRVADIHDTYLLGLQDAEFEDATKENARTIQREEKLSISNETDRVYLSPSKELFLYEADAPSLRIEQQGFTDTVVWNPGPAKARSLKDFPDDGWLQMLCVEAACVDKQVILQPGESWTGSQILTIPN